jgi:peroxiredoxin
MINNKTNKYLFLSLLSLIIIGTALYGLLTHTFPTPASSTHFKTIANKQVSLKQLQGKVVLVTFWASNCPSCLKEIPHLISLYNDYHQRGLELFAIAMHYDRPNYVVNTRKTYQIPYDIVLDLQGQLATAFGDISLTPTTLLINSSGEIIYQNIGTFDLQAMQVLIESLLPIQGNK